MEAMKKKALKTYTLEEITGKYIGNRGTPKRETFEEELRKDLLKGTVNETCDKHDMAVKSKFFILTFLENRNVGALCYYLKICKWLNHVS